MSASLERDAGDVTRNLYDALMRARPYVSAYVVGDGRDRTRNRVRHASGTLESCDAALADAADYLQGEQPCQS
jgi:hypothetical protein